MMFEDGTEGSGRGSELWMRNDSGRAVRYDIRVPVLYRRSGNRTWSKAKTLNISRTGLLVHPAEALDSGARLDLMFTLPLKVGRSRGTRVMCSGFVARTAKVTGESSFGIGIQFSNFILTSSPPRAAAQGRPIRDRMN